MFGIVERARLAMYESTLRQAKSDAAEATSLYTLALISGIAGLSNCVQFVAKSTGGLRAENTLHHTMQSIPSQYLSDIDAVLLRSIKSPTSGIDSYYRMITLLNGLLFVRVVEVTRPSMVSRAHTFRDAALSLLEPYYAQGLAIASAGSSHNPEKVADQLADMALGTLSRAHQRMTDRDEIMRIICAAEKAVELVAPDRPNPTVGSSAYSRLEPLTSVEAEQAHDKLSALTVHFMKQDAHGYAIGTELIVRLIEIHHYRLAHTARALPSKLLSAFGDIQHCIDFCKGLIAQAEQEELVSGLAS